MSRPPARQPAKRGSVAARLRDQIEAAEAEGVVRSDMVLRLTHTDASHLKRDGTLGVSDISFSEGVMRFLGVRIEEGGVQASSLQKAEA